MEKKNKWSQHKKIMNILGDKWTKKKLETTTEHTKAMDMNAARNNWLRLQHCSLEYAMWKHINDDI